MATNNKFIDDITFASSNPAAIDSAIKELASHFKLRDLGPTSFLLGIEIVLNLDTQQICYEAHRRECAEANCKIARSSDTISDS